MVLLPPSPPHAASQVPLYLTLAAGGSLRLLLSLTNLSEVLMNRNELSTPITSWIRLREGYHLSTVLSQNPYVGGSFHHPPLLLLLPLASPLACKLIWIIAEVATAFCLARVADSRIKRDLVEGEGEEVWSGWRVAALYLLHPFSIATTLAKSTIIFSNLFVALAIFSATSGSLLSTVFSLSLATHLSLYPALLLPPLVLLLANKSNESRMTTASLATIGFGAHQILVLFLANWLSGSWDFLGSVYGVILTIPDLTPTIGLGWYFFIEMFDHFRSFFVGVFQLHVLIYVAPLTVHYRDDPLFALVLIVGIISIFKSYPSLGDFALWHALLGCFSEMGTHISRPLLLFSLTLYSLFLLPTFSYLWLYSGSGNANFFYASTLVWAISQGGLLIDLLTSRERREVLRELGNKGREKVKQGRWVVTQK